MFELADRLVGIYNTHDTTKSVTINPKMFEQGLSMKQQTLMDNSSTVDEEMISLQPEPFIKSKRILADSTNTASRRIS